MKSHIVLLLFSMLFLSVQAQLLVPMDNRHEIGVFLGANNYIGDVGRSSYLYPTNYAFGAIYKLNVSKRHAVRVFSNMAKIFASDLHTTDSTKIHRSKVVNNEVIELGSAWEFSFFSFNPDLKGAHTFYTFIGVNAFMYNYFELTNIHSFFRDQNNIIIDDGLQGGDFTQFSTLTRIKKNKAFSVAIPFGLGYKYKFSQRIIVSLEAGFRRTFTDNLDNSSVSEENFISSEIEENLLSFVGVENVIRFRDMETIANYNFGHINNKDWYVFSGITLTYTFGRAPCYCGDDKKRRSKKFKFR